MSRLEELIQEYCPNGVEYRALQELGSFFGGLTGKGKDDFGKGGSHFITYMNVFSNIALDMESTEYVTLMPDEKQNRLQLGDVIFTGSSETRAESGMSSVVTKKPKSDIYLNSFCFGFRFVDCELMNPDFSKHIFRSTEIRNQIIKTANGVTRYNISKKLMEKVRIPLPPLPVQEEIVRILDKFTTLEAELEAELEARKKQYEYYFDMLLDSMPNIPKRKLGEVCKIISGGTPSKTKFEYWYGGKIKWLGSTVCQNKKTVSSVTNHITEEGLKNSSAKLLGKGTTLIALVGATIGKVAFLDFEATINQNIAGVYPLNDATLLPSYVYYACKKLYPIFIGLTNGKLAMANLSFVRELSIPLPPLAEQERIVSILDRFDALVNDITQGLPAEIEARRKQYEYYRNQLLTFKEATP